MVGGCERVGGFNLPYTECYDPVTGEWKSLAKLPEFTKSEYAVCALRNDILVSGKTTIHLLHSMVLSRLEIYTSHNAMHRYPIKVHYVSFNCKVIIYFGD